MQPWMIEELEKSKRSRQDKRIPLYLPLEQTSVTGSSEQDKIDKKETAIIDYSTLSQLSRPDRYLPREEQGQ